MLGCLFEIVETLVLTLIIFLVIQNFVAQPYKVQQQSMEQRWSPTSTSGGQVDAH
jgi:signal peptidase I